MDGCSALMVMSRVAPDGAGAEPGSASWKLLKIRLAASCVLCEDGPEQILAQLRQALADAGGLAVVRVAQCTGTVGLDIPTQVGVILWLERVREGQGAGLLAREADAHLVGVGEVEVELGGYAGCSLLWGVVES
jgi:hypothetical protein